MIRAFLALPLPAALIPVATLAQHGLQLDNPVPRENLHLTLAFLGNTSRAQLEDLHASLETETLPQAPIAITGVGAFGHDGPRSLHLIIAENPALSALHRACARAARAAGIALPARRFVPHVTLAYLNRAQTDADIALALERLGPVGAPPVLAETLVLFRSTLTKAGSLHDAMAEYPLHAVPGPA